MLEYKSGDLLSEDAEALVNTVNCLGVMGRGLALAFKKAFPANFKVYKEACDRREVKPGKMLVFETGELTNPQYIINFPTKRHWRFASRMEDLEAGLKDLVAVVQERKIRSIAVPPLGCGMGGLDWEEVRPRIEDALEPLEGVQVVVYTPESVPQDGRAIRNRKVPEMTSGRAALVAMLDRYVKAQLDPVVTLLEVHKLMYFMQEVGEPLGLQYQKARHGPYAKNLRDTLKAIEGYLIMGYDGDSDAPEKELELLPGAVEDAEAFLDEHPDTRQRLEQVMALIEGFETPLGLELLSSVHWILGHGAEVVANYETRYQYSATFSFSRDLDKAATPSDDLVERVHAWGENKREFTPRHINLARDRLQEGGWV